MEQHTKTDVLIVGAGPTGLALAIGLHLKGIDYLLIDKLPQGQNTSRAAVIHAHTLDMLEHLGVAQGLTDRGLKLRDFTIRDRDRALVQLPFNRLPSPHSYLLMLPQNITEEVLADRLAALGGTIHRGITATSIQQDAQGARAILAAPEGERTVEARYVVGGDGIHSIVRTAAGIEFDGSAYAESFVLADVRMDWPLGPSEVSLFFSTGGVVVVAPLPDGTYRIVATLENAPEQPGIADIQALLDRSGPASHPAVVTEIVWGSRFRIHHRLARKYRDGRFFLMGDAAHVHSPAGGQGMNCGLVDAVVLGQLLAEVIRGQRPESALETYEQLRRPAAAQVLKLADTLTGLATMKSAWKRALRNTVMSVVNVLPPVRQRLIMNLSGLSRRAMTLTTA